MNEGENGGRGTGVFGRKQSEEGASIEKAALYKCNAGWRSSGKYLHCREWNNIQARSMKDRAQSACSSGIAYRPSPTRRSTDNLSNILLRITLIVKYVIITSI